MLSKSKQRQLLSSLKEYHRQYLKKINPELDESGTRLMVNSFLTDVLGFEPIQEVRTEYQIRGAYADYVINVKEVIHFLVEVKALGIQLSEKHLRQARQYCADEGIDWALLTNGKQFDFYKIGNEKPITEKKVFSIDLSDASKLKQNMETVQYLHKLSVTDKGLNLLWNKCVALDPKTVAGLLHNKPVLNFLRKALKKRYKHKFTDVEIGNSLNKIIYEAIQLDDIKQTTLRKRKKGTPESTSTENQAENIISSETHNESIVNTGNSVT